CGSNYAISVSNSDSSAPWYVMRVTGRDPLPSSQHLERSSPEPGPHGTPPNASLLPEPRDVPPLLSPTGRGWREAFLPAPLDRQRRGSVRLPEFHPIQAFAPPPGILTSPGWQDVPQRLLSNAAALQHPKGIEK